MSKFYLSSTFRDLEECRKKVAETLRQLGHTVIGMEDYTADGRPPLKKVLADIAECDAYLGIFAWRYGYIPREDNPRKLAITELEYREALRLNKEPLIFILSEAAPWPGDQIAQNDKERKQIKTLRENLSRAHTVKFFTDCNDLATKVSVAVSRFPKDRESKPIPPPPPPPPPPQPERWKWYVLAGLVVVALLGIVSYQLKAKYWAKGYPPEYPTEKKYDFLLAEKDSLPAMWHLPPGSWDLEEGDSKGNIDGSLVFKGNQMATPKDLGNRVFYNYQATFPVHFKSGDRVGWVLRAQSDAQSGYLFELRKSNGTVNIKGWILKNNKIAGDPLPGDKLLRYTTCCLETDALLVVAEVTDNPKDGTHFKYQFTFLSKEGSRKQGEEDETFETADAEFIDNESTFRWGTFGLLVPDGITTTTTANGVMSVEYVYLTPLSKVGEPAPVSSEGNSR